MDVTKQMIIVMTVIGVLSSLILAASDLMTKDRIKKNKQEALEKAIFEVLPEAKGYESIGTETFKVYKGLNAKKDVIGYAFIAEGPGFQGNIRMMVGITPKLDTLLGMNVLEQVETPGLGGNIGLDSFRKQFSDLKLPVSKVDTTTSASSNFISYVKNIAPQNPGEIQAITGATISSKAVVSTLNKSLTELHKILQQ